MRISKDVLKAFDRTPHEIAAAQAGKEAFDRLKARGKALGRFPDATEALVDALVSVAEELWAETYRYRKVAR